jgi:hypothetical protein
MKRLDLVQLVIIIVGIFSGFFFILTLPQFLSIFLAWFSAGLSGTYMTPLIWQIALSGGYLLAAFYCVKRSKHFAEWICRNGNLDADINFALDKAELLFALFVGLGIYGLIKHLPMFIVDGFSYLKGRNRSGLSGMFDDGGKEIAGSDIIVQLLSLLLFFVLVYYAKVFADFFTAKIKNTEPEDAIDNKTED